MRFFSLTVLATLATEPAFAEELWSSDPPSKGVAELRHVSASWEKATDSRLLRLEVKGARKQSYAWVTLPAPSAGWKLDRRKSVEAHIANRGKTPVYTMLWVVGKRGWSAVGDFATLAPGESRHFSADLRQTFPDGTPKLDPGQVKQVQFMVRQADPGTVLEVTGLRAAGEAAPWKKPEGRIEVPDMESGEPAAGRRVRYQFDDDDPAGIYGALYLPKHWKPGQRFPVIVEYPGNIFLNNRCYSTGRPEQCVMGYGTSEGKAIWVSLPFIDRAEGTIIENGFGNADGTAAYAVRAVETICREFGGDPDKVILTGFSRGSIACGYIGLRSEAIAGLWKGIHGCQHYDGSKWNQSDMAGAVERAPRFRGRAIFQTDNSQERYQPVVDATDPSVEWTWVKSGLNFHDTAMFLDDRPSTIALRKWYRNLIESGQGKGQN